MSTNTTIDTFTDLVIFKEKYFAFFIWKNGKKYGVDLSKQQIQDVLSESYLTAVTKIRSYEKIRIDFPLAWFSRVVYLTLMNYIRKEILKNKVIDIADIEDLRDTNFVFETIDQYQNDELIKDIMAKLPDEERTFLQLLLDGYSYKEISQLTKKKYDAVRQMKSRIVKKIKKLL